MSESWRILDQFVRLIREGRVDDSQATKLLMASGVNMNCLGKVGTYKNGMLKIGAGVTTLDPANISDFHVPEAAPPEPAPKPALKPKPRVIDLSVKTDAKFVDDVS